ISVTSQTSSNESVRSFPLTRWSLVLAATRENNPDSAAALESLCRCYWNPLYAYVLRRGQSPHDAQDITQEFFCRLLEKRWLESADREKGKLRTFLIIALKKFMSNEWRRASAQRRGGGVKPVSFDHETMEKIHAVAASSQDDGDRSYDKDWAMTLLDLTVKRLRDEFSLAQKLNDFEILKDSLSATNGNIDYTEISRRLGASEGGTRVAVHRLRKRFREIYREEISQTLSEGEDIESEMRFLATALAGK
ncbi:MAG: hypothetical protein JWN25_9, partial [Verrucomicrobiales bacterium]|nr:hypothetical protein [Verrucomicrobiales bacterium]